MQGKKVTEGKTIAFRLQGSILYLGENDEIQVDLASRERDVGVALDFFLDDQGRVKEGSGYFYAANVLIPPGRYKDVMVQDKDMNGSPITTVKKEAEPLDVNRVTLQLWGIPEKNKTIGGM